MATGFVRAARLALAAAVLAVACASQRMSIDEADWVGPREGDFETDSQHCLGRMAEAPWRFGGDRRLIYRACMERRGWHRKS